MPFHLHKIGIVNPSSLGDTIVLSSVLEGANNATRETVTRTFESIVIEDGQEVRDTEILELQVAGLPTNSSDYTQLRAWEGDTDLTISGHSIEGFFQMEEAKINLIRESNERTVWGISAKKEFSRGFKDNKRPAMMSKNGLSLDLFDEEGSTNMPTGWTKSGGSTTFDNPNLELDFSTTGATQQHVYKDAYYPDMAGKSVVFSVNVSAVTVTTGVTIGILAYDSAGSAIGSESTTSISATGKATVSRTLPSNVISIRCRVSIGQNDSISFGQPMLAHKTTTPYIER